MIKPRDYEIAEDVEAASSYAAWRLLASTPRPLRPGDVLEEIHADEQPGSLQIAKYIGFEPAQWFVAPPKGDPLTCSGPDSPPAAQLSP